MYIDQTNTLLHQACVKLAQSSCGEEITGVQLNTISLLNNLVNLMNLTETLKNYCQARYF